LIEVLVAILILSFGMLALGAMLSFAVQMPKLSGYRATATNLAAAHVERIRANPEGFKTIDYTAALSYDGTFDALYLDDCVYPNCIVATLARMDNAATNQAVRLALPAGGMMLQCDPSPCTTTSNSYGNLWIVWQEPSTYAALNPTSSDNCPAEVTGTYTEPKPRCLYVRFKI
jgi:type IV pilus assembly protein PilV